VVLKTLKNSPPWITITICQTKWCHLFMCGWWWCSIWHFVIMREGIHYEKSCLLKPHYLVTKTQKTIDIQLLCNYPLDITTTMQLSS
jgi:hypothetical protein